jgi:membrane dipeptidase
MRIRSKFAVLALSMMAAHATLAAEATPAAHKLAENTVIVDTHIDAPTELMKAWMDLAEAQPREFDFPKARAGGLDVAFMSIYTSSGQDEDGSAYNVANRMIDAVEKMAGDHPDKFALLRSPRDVEALRRRGLVLLPMGMENGAPIGDDLGKLKYFHDRGIRYITLAHSANNRIADSSYATGKKWNGLSPFGRDVVAEMNHLGIMIDVSHLSDAAVAQAVELSETPVVATHSALRHFTPGFERNLSDDLAKAIAAKGGTIQIPFGNAFVDPASAAQTQAYFVAYNAYLREHAAGNTTQTVAEFDDSWEKSHPPLKVMIEGKPVFLCCKECTKEAMNGGAATVKMAEKLRAATAELAKLPMEERMAAEAQKYCAINTKGFLGSMGAPIKLMLDGKPVYLCCDGCTEKAQANPATTLAKVEELKHAGMHKEHGHEHATPKK